MPRAKQRFGAWIDRRRVLQLVLLVPKASRAACSASARHSLRCHLASASSTAFDAVTPRDLIKNRVMGSTAPAKPCVWLRLVAFASLQNL